MKWRKPARDPHTPPSDFDLELEMTPEGRTTIGILPIDNDPIRWGTDPRKSPFGTGLIVFLYPEHPEQTEEPSGHEPLVCD